ncbi:hypothetical protein LZQ00_02290 [Sphingobacterium sp. SRCM116780]|uniref:hypothetical protein n=1 Tax=Sphingobacterium sp. SRCM116780 TaxID=2907623 RepID=UPI001F490979|nr:hypothetical protein [Sphingobacterium sp. SRCM116780]UIR56655.1 hypothetical protein LZQ00_02290 [Sphingobacterium sp. SRCM116780]
MKFNKLFVAVAVCGSSLLASCNYQTGLDNQYKNSRASLADGDAYAMFKLVGEQGNYLVNLAKFAETKSTSAETKALSAKIQETYGTILPQLDSLALSLHVNDPMRGVPAFQAPIELGADSTAAFNDHAYSALVAKVQAEVNSKLVKESQNTNADINHFSHESLEKLEEVYKLAGGKVDEHEHH